MKQSILITGANGFIGKSLTELLKDDYNIISKNRYELDILDLDSLKEFFNNHNIDFVIHTASCGGRRFEYDGPRAFYENTKMFENLKLFKNKYKLMITFGSGAESGSFPLNYYGLSKKYIVKKIYAEELNMVNFRLWGCFGKHEFADRFIKANMTRYKNKNPMIIHNDKIMDFFYIEDMIPIIKYFLSSDKYDFLLKDYNLCYERKYTLKNVCNIINKLDDYKVNIIEDAFKSLDPYVGNSSAVEFILKDNIIGLEEGIKKMWNEL